MGCNVLWEGVHIERERESFDIPAKSDSLCKRGGGELTQTHTSKHTNTHS